MQTYVRTNIHRRTLYMLYTRLLYFMYMAHGAKHIVLIAISR